MVPQENLDGREYAIVGFDPGNTSAVAAVDFDGRLILARSRAGMSFEDAVSLIGDHCVPAAFASDVAPAQDATRKLAAAFGCRTWAPETSLSILEKKRIVFENTAGGLDVHERDAAAAALFCLFSTSQVIDRARRKFPEGWKERVYLVLKGLAKNVSEEEKRVLEPEPVPARVKQPDFLRIRLLKERVRALEESVERLKETEREKEELRKRRAEAFQRPRSVETHLLKPVVLVQNRAALERASVSSEGVKRSIGQLSGSRVVILKLGEQVGMLLLVRETSGLRAQEILARKVKAVFYERGQANPLLPCKQVRVAGGRSLFEGEFALVSEEDGMLSRDEERRWNQAYLRFVASSS